MPPSPTSIEFVVRIGDAPPPPAAIDRWPDAIWSHHADPLDGLVELGRKVFETRTGQAWTAETSPRIAVLVTLRDAAAELAAAIASHLPTIELLIASAAGDLLEVEGRRTESRSESRSERSKEDSPPIASDTPPPPTVSDRHDPRTVSSDEIRMLLGDAGRNADDDLAEEGP